MPIAGLFALLASCQSTPDAVAPQRIEGLYPDISGSFSGRPVAQSPDPLVAYRWESPRATDDLQSYVIFPKSVVSDRPENAAWKARTTMPITVSGPCDLMFDFGQVNAGWLEFDAADLDGDVEMSISEFREPAVFNAGSEHPKKTAVPVRYGDTYRLELNKGLYEGVRFGWIHVRNLNRPATISEVRLVCQTKPANYEGSFACSDTMLTRIWYTGAYDVKLNLLKDYFGAILMERSDRHSWTGDAHPSQAASMVAFGNFDFVRTNLFYTSTQFNGIASYSLYWVLSLIDYYNYTGDTETLSALVDNACDKLDIAYGHYGTNPDLQFYGWDERLGAGFENPNCAESQNAYKMLSIRAWNEFAGAMDAFGRKDLADKYRGYAAEKVAGLRGDAQWAAPLGLFAAADAATAGFATPDEQQALWNAAFADRQQRLSYSPFNQYFVIQAMARMGRYDEALATIDDCWGGQVRYGGTTFFEVYRPSWNDAIPENGAPVNNQCGYTSLTHPWSAGVVKWLSEEVLGIRPLTPGFATFSFAPHLSAAVTSVQGDVPTPHGTINASFDLLTGKGSIEVPEGTTGRLGIPKAGQRIESVTIDGKPCATDKEDTFFAYCGSLSPGKHTIGVKYAGSPTAAAQPALQYAYARTAEQDSTTRGDWKGKYGSQGYLLFSYDADGQNRMQLAPSTLGIATNKGGDRFVAEAQSDPRALVSDRPGDESRRIGRLVTLDPAACMQTMTLDIRRREPGPYRIALYFVDWERDGRRSAVEAFDLDTKQLLMPVQIVDRYGDGKYLILEADRSVRLRIDQVRGANASLSGVFID